MQEIALQLMGKKLEAAMALNGEFSTEGLNEIAESDSMVIAMAKTLVEKIDTESADKIWQKLYSGKAKPKEIQYESKNNKTNSSIVTITITKTNNKKGIVSGQVALDHDSLCVNL